jgi:hypothetical protein
MRIREIYVTVRAPKLMIAVGACAISGGRFARSDQVHERDSQRTSSLTRMFLNVPLTIRALDGLSRLLGRLPASADVPMTRHGLWRDRGEGFET